MSHVGVHDVHVGGLADGCPRCNELAAHPTRDLDDVALAAVVELAVRPDRLAVSRSGNEALASATVLTTLERVGRIAQVAPEALEQYLTERWRIRCKIGP